MKISTKLIGGFLVVAAVTLLVGIFGYTGLSRVTARQKETIKRDAALRQAVDAARSAQVAFKIQVQEWKDLLLRGHDPAAYAKYSAAFTDQETVTHKDLVDLKGCMAALDLPTDAVDSAIQTHADLGMKYREALKSFVTARPESTAVVDGLVKGLDRPPTAKIDEIVAGINQFAGTQGAAAEAQASAQAHFYQVADGLSVLIGVVLSVALGIYLSLAVTRPIHRVTEGLSAAAEQTAAAAGEVSTASQLLAEGASEQAASLEETSSSLEEMSSMTKRNADHAHQANELAKQARAAADRGMGDMQAMTTAMNAIKSASDDIAKIIKTIDEIAFQTNILALTAAVEAARAGEAGMGFAVVADEVRNLAQRSAQAARETAVMIEGAISKTGQGVEISRKVSETLKELVTKARQVDELVAEVAGASGEQTQGITQINTAVGQMDKVTQSNAANAEESAAAAEELNAEAVVMKAAVRDLLQLIGGGGSETTIAPAPAPKSRRVAPAQPVPAHENHRNRTAPARPAKAAPRDEIPMAGDFKDF